MERDGLLLMVAGSCLLPELEGNRADSVRGVLLHGEASPERNPLLLHRVLVGPASLPPLLMWELVVVAVVGAVVCENWPTRPMLSQWDPFASPLLLLLPGGPGSVWDSH